MAGTRVGPAWDTLLGNEAHLFKLILFKPIHPDAIKDLKKMVGPEHINKGAEEV